MKIFVNWHTLEVDTTNGYGVQVINTFTSKDKSEIDTYIEWLKVKFGDGFVCESGKELEQ